MRDTKATMGDKLTNANSQENHGSHGIKSQNNFPSLESEMTVRQTPSQTMNNKKASSGEKPRSERKAFKRATKLPLQVLAWKHVQKQQQAARITPSCYSALNVVGIVSASKVTLWRSKQSFIWTLQKME